MSDMPEKIWAMVPLIGEYWADPPVTLGDHFYLTEYTRADLPPTPEQIAADPRVQKLVEALRSVTDAYKKGGMPIAQSRARAVLAEFTTPTTTKETT